jgi:hypothetical protein
MTKRIIFLFYLFLITILLSNCKKEFDIRDKYVGNFNFNINEHIFNFKDSTYFDTIIYFYGAIYKPDNYPANFIYIHYLPDMTLEFVMDKSGEIEKPAGGTLGAAWTGKFDSKDKVTLIYYCYGTTQHISGSRN